MHKINVVLYISHDLSEALLYSSVPLCGIPCGILCTTELSNLLSQLSVTCCPCVTVTLSPVTMSPVTMSPLGPHEVETIQGGPAGLVSLPHPVPTSRGRGG